MLNKHHIEKILKLNGVEPSSPDGDIKSVLLRARWKEDDIETALVVLRENKETMERKIDTLHRVFHSDDHLEPEMVSSLLGVDITENLRNHKIRYEQSQANMAHATIGIITVSLVICCSLLLLSMWMWKIGPFHAMY